MSGNCAHEVYIKGLCGNCGAKLDPPQSTSVSMIHSVPELKVSHRYAKEIGKADQDRLINDRKLVLLVDLDQTILHTTNEEVRNDPNVHAFQLWPGHPFYYTKLRPYLKEFLDSMSKIYELHIFTFGCRKYAHKIASIIDPQQKYFGNRILSRDESVDQYSKKGNLNNLFPCGDAMVCIIDDRSDVWKDAGNLIQVKPYCYHKTSIHDGAARGEEESQEDDEDADRLEALLGFSDNVENSSEKKDDIATATSQPEEGPPEDLDDHLMYLGSLLDHIHDKWYRELDARREYLMEGEAYKLPDIKEIIKGHLKKQDVKDRQKAHRFQYLTRRLFDLRRHRSPEIFKLSKELLLINPDVYTVWNIRREALLAYAEQNPDQNIWKEELSFTLDCLQKNEKSYSVWQHRIWTLSKMPASEYEVEILLCNSFLSKDERNFHCWDYRNYICDIAQANIEKEFEFTTEKIKSNFSNFSAWHRRHKLLLKGLENPDCPDSCNLKIIWPQEYNMLLNALFTDPLDQSPWLYHNWLIKNNFGFLGQDQIEKLKTLRELEPDNRWIKQALDLAVQHCH